jgi:hypothetical protein
MFRNLVSGVRPILPASRPLLMLSCVALVLLPPAAWSEAALDAFSAPTVNDFLMACQASQNNCQDAVGTALLEKGSHSGNVDICLPSTDYAKAVPGWLAAHPETHALKTNDGIYLALQKLYPCDGPQNQAAS